MGCRVEVQFDGIDHYISIPADILKESGLEAGDRINCLDNDNGSFTLEKIEETEVVLVEAIQQTRMRYLVNVPKGKAEYALDTVTLQEADEFSQEDLGEIIVSHRVINDTEILELFTTDRPYYTNMTDAEKLRETREHNNSI
jgi:bifunctional DNA-binding transcriptional regulator/antitoxin component of YhaV-PrlF toxin-antitoxin module